MSTRQNLGLLCMATKDNNNDDNADDEVCDDNNNNNNNNNKLQLNKESTGHKKHIDTYTCTCHKKLNFYFSIKSAFVYVAMW